MEGGEGSGRGVLSGEVLLTFYILEFLQSLLGWSACIIQFLPGISPFSSFSGSFLLLKPITDALSFEKEHKTKCDLTFSIQ